MKTKRFLLLFIFSFLVNIPVVSADDYGKACSGYVNGSRQNGTCVRQGFCSGTNKEISSALLAGDSESQCAGMVCCVADSSSPDNFANSQYYGKSCVGTLNGNMQAGTCVRSTICASGRAISNSADCGSATLGGVCCASPDKSATFGDPYYDGTGGSNMPAPGFTNVGGISLPSMTGLSDAPLESVIIGFISWLLAMIGFIAVLAFLISGAQYLLSYGDDDMIERAKETMKWSIVGLAVAFSGFIIIRAITTLLTGSPFF